MKNALYESAVDRIRDEMAGTKDDAIQAVGEMMTEQLRAQPQISEFVQKKGKTLSGAYKAISDYASKHRTGNHAVVPPAKAMELIAAYYGFTPTEGKPSPSAEETQAHAEMGARPAGAIDDELDLDKLLEG